MLTHNWTIPYSKEKSHFDKNELDPKMPNNLESLLGHFYFNEKSEEYNISLEKQVRSQTCHTRCSNLV